eukprot:CAMPEP_0183308288 /NCGR_PEP_ID=MMETSP0160_2-20130417/21119_1 /TAXON_ID=2839 ORGANISM="Odontella Sinensis, Strain Grunow 1884" /NCGR_SAMPLE_ID=MMETSP0160_2 /ASSEMBLY_ACC=CAM_ASM_000250 /LENGTH=191 /DNA_ID=CAMNT_0025472095 /DNA_START=82 /DNA_END=658 /DNA_ORIENTATION=-
MPDQVRAAHLLIKHTGSRNPVSRRTNQTIALSPEQAIEELKSYEARIKAEGVDNSFPRYAQERSDCSSFARNGDLGFFGRGQMQRPFEEAAFGLEVGQMTALSPLTVAITSFTGLPEESMPLARQDVEKGTGERPWNSMKNVKDSLTIRIEAYVSHGGIVGLLLGQIAKDVRLPHPVCLPTFWFRMGQIET